MMNQHYGLPGCNVRNGRQGGGYDRTPCRSRQGRESTAGNGCGCSSRGRSQDDRDVTRRSDNRGCGCSGVRTGGCFNTRTGGCSNTRTGGCSNTRTGGCFNTRTGDCPDTRRGDCSDGWSLGRDTVTPGPCTKPTVDGCGCGVTPADVPTAACRKLMEQIRAVDFALYEVILYLDVYPHCHEALDTYHKLKARSEMLRGEYEATVGPITAFGNQCTTSWDWMKKPFPWEYDAE